jgi:hypothetical protein
MFKPLLKRLYLLTFKNEKNEIFLIQIDLTQKNSYKIVKIKLDAIFFEIDQKDPEKFYFIEEKIIYSMDFSVQESTFGGIFGGNGNSNGNEKNLYGAKEFFRSKYELEFIRFGSEMKHFFINEGKTIKMLSAESFEVKKVFDQQDFDPVDIFFSTNFEFMFRY